MREQGDQLHEEEPQDDQAEGQQNGPRRRVKVSRAGRRSAVVRAVASSDPADPHRRSCRRLSAMC